VLRRQKIQQPHEIFYRLRILRYRRVVSVECRLMTNPSRYRQQNHASTGWLLTSLPPIAQPASH
jgi:hypothetical protein